MTRPAELPDGDCPAAPLPDPPPDPPCAPEAWAGVLLDGTVVDELPVELEAPWAPADEPPEELEPTGDPVAGTFELTEVVGGAVVVGVSTASADVAVPAPQFTGPPPTACQVSPVTWMSRVG